MSKITQDSGPRWVVLIDKNPVGPFTEEEIREKFVKGDVRPNDIAFKVDPETSEPGSEWKFLWQFMEFERRRNVALPSEPAFAADSERRTMSTEDEMRQRVLAALPPEFHELPSLTADRLPTEPAEIGVDPESKDSDVTERFRLPRQRVTIWNTLPIVAFAIAAIALTWLFLSRTMPVDDASRVPAEAPHKSPAKPLKKK